MSERPKCLCVLCRKALLIAEKDAAIVTLTAENATLTQRADKWQGMANDFEDRLETALAEAGRLRDALEEIKRTLELRDHSDYLQRLAHRLATETLATTPPAASDGRASEVRVIEAALGFVDDEIFGLTELREAVAELKAAAGEVIDECVAEAKETVAAMSNEQVMAELGRKLASRDAAP